MIEKLVWRNMDRCGDTVSKEWYIRTTRKSRNGRKVISYEDDTVEALFPFAIEPMYENLKNIYMVIFFINLNQIYLYFDSSLRHYYMIQDDEELYMFFGNVPARFKRRK